MLFKAVGVLELLGKSGEQSASLIPRWAMVTQKPRARTLPSRSPPDTRLRRLHALPVGPSYSRRATADSYPAAGS